MIAVVLLVLIVLLLAVTPWRRLSAAGRLWAVAALLNTIIFFGLPTTLATSPWRPVVERVAAASAATSLGLVVLGLILRQHQGPAAGGGPWTGLLILGALPLVAYAVIWIIGPVY